MGLKLVIIINHSVTLGFKFQPVSMGVGESWYILLWPDPDEGGPGLDYVA
jgi:hypothetical protein